jgi:hypothetical protein
VGTEVGNVAGDRCVGKDRHGGGHRRRVEHGTITEVSDVVVENQLILTGKGQDPKGLPSMRLRILGTELGLECEMNHTLLARINELTSQLDTERQEKSDKSFLHPLINLLMLEQTLSRLLQQIFSNS